MGKSRTGRQEGEQMKVTLNGESVECSKECTYRELAERVQGSYAHRIVLAIADNKIRELFWTVKDGADITFLTVQDRIGHDTYVRSAVMLLMKAAADVAGAPEKGKLKVEFSIGKGLYCSPKGGLEIDEAFVLRVKQRMRELVKEQLRFVKQAYPTDDAIQLFAEQGMSDKVQLFKYRRGSYINVYCLDGYYDYYYGYMVPDTGYLECFDVVRYREGLMLMLPDAADPAETPEPEERAKLFETLYQSSRWGDRIGIDTVGDLNDKICEGAWRS